MQIFERTKTVTINQYEPSTLEVTAYFKDKFHDIKIYLTFDCGSRVITKAKAEMMTVPFDLCLEVCAKMHELEGVAIKRGIRKFVQDVIGNAKGCAHLFDMVMDSIKAVIQVADFCLLPEEMPFDEKLENIKKTNMGICHTYNSLGRQPKYIGNRKF